MARNISTPDADSIKKTLVSCPIATENVYQADASTHSLIQLADPANAHLSASSSPTSPRSLSGSADALSQKVQKIQNVP